MASPHYFFCGIGGSGMMPLAMIVAARGAHVSGSDRSLDQGRIPEKFAALKRLGVALFPQDGSGPREDDIFIASAAIEDGVPDMVAANRLGLKRMSRAELLAELFNSSPFSIAIGGTSGKSTVTGMIGWILDQSGRDPTIMNGAVMKNYASPDAPFASARVGKGEVFVSEVDESDGTIALYRPTIAVLNNVTLDHKPIEELRALFANFLQHAEWAAVNADDPEMETLPFDEAGALTFGFARGAQLCGKVIEMRQDGTDFEYSDCGAPFRPARLKLPGRHNVLNALAAMSASHLAGISYEQSVEALSRFEGLRRRFDIVGTAGGVTVIDDFGHNPDKIAATLDTLHAFPGRLLVMFQPHGYGPLRLMGRELAEMFRARLGVEDRLFLPDPAYYGGTVDRSRGSDALAEAIGPRAEYLSDRAAIGSRLVAEARPGDRIIVMGARDDTLSSFAADLLERLDG